MSFSTIRRRIAVCSAIAMVSATGASQAGAQASGSTDENAGGWGGEGRINTNAVYLTRWFNRDWSALLGGSANISTQESDPSTGKTTSKTGNINFLIRHSWGGGMVRPYLAAGPSVTFSTQETKSAVSPQGPYKTTNTGLQGRGEIGALVPVVSKVFLGLSASAFVNRVNSESTPPNGVKAKSHTTAFSAGNLAFIVAVRF